MVDQNDRAAGNADAAISAAKQAGFGTTEATYSASTDRTIVLEVEVLGIHHVQRIDIAQLIALDPAARLFQHLGRDIDAGDARIGAEMGPRQPGADPDL